MSKNNSINFWRVIFTMSIVIFHFSGTYTQFNAAFHAKNGWRIAVEFFFVVSGFLLAYKCEHSDLTAWVYTKHRFKRFFPVYFVTLMMMTILRIINNSMSLKQASSLIANLIDELMLLQGFAWHYVTTNGPSWYISALIICGYFIFYLLKKHNDLFTRFIAPLTCVIAYSYLSIKMGCLSGNVYHQSDILGLSIAIIRGFAGMSAGVISYELYKSLKKVDFTKLGTATARLVEIAGFIFVLAYTFFIGSTHMDFYFVIIFIVCTAVGFSREKKSIIFNNKAIDYLAKISFSIYLIHSFVISIFKKFYKPDQFSWKMFILFLISTIAAGAICDFVCSKAVGFIEKKSKQHGGFFIRNKSMSKKA